MELKRILAKDTRSATEQAIRLYGEDVLIISNHKVGTQTELVLAVDIAAPAQVAAAEPVTPSGVFKSHFRQASSEQHAGDEKPTQPAASQDRDRIRSQEIVALVREELADLRREFRLSQQRSLSWPTEQHMATEIAPLVQHLKSVVPSALLSLLLDGLQSHSDPQAAIAQLQAQLESAIQNPEGQMPQRGVHVLAGASGCGKSTMGARLAQWASQEWGAEQVALISYRDQRAGAWSQAQMLAAVAGVEVFRVMDAAGLGVLLSELSHRAMVVIDTPGIEMQRHVNEIVSVCPQAQVHAVLPADASETSCKRVLQHSGLAFTDLMLSKFDETEAPWPLIQFLCNHARPLACSLVGESDRLNGAARLWTPRMLVELATSTLTLAAIGTSHPLAHHADSSMAARPW